LVEKIAALDGVGVQLVGDLEIVPADLRVRLEAVTTDSDCGMRVNVAVGYGGRQEIVNAVRSLLRARNDDGTDLEDRKSTRLNSSHVSISYAVFCLKKKKK